MNTNQRKRAAKGMADDTASRATSEPEQEIGGAAVDASRAPIREPARGEKPGGFLARSGAPCEALGGQKPGEFLASSSLETALSEATSPHKIQVKKKSKRKKICVAVESTLVVATSGAVVDKGGRPSVVDENLKTQVCLLLSVGLSRRQAAAYLDIVHTTISNAMQREPEFAARVLRAEELAVAKPIVTIAAASQRNWRAAAWLLERNERRRPKTAEELEEAHELGIQTSRNVANELMEMERIMQERGHELQDKNWQRYFAGGGGVAKPATTSPQT